MKWAGIGIGAGIIGGVGIFFYRRRLSRLEKELQTVIKVSIHSLKLDGLAIRVDAKMKNPTNGSLRLRFPYVSIAHKGVTIGTSDSIDKMIDLPAFGEANIESIMVKVPFAGLFNLGSGLYQQLIKKEAVLLDVKTVSTLYVGALGIPKNYEKTDKITLGPVGEQVKIENGKVKN